MFRFTKKTWVVVADGEKALLLRNLTDSLTPSLAVVAREEQDNPADGAQRADRPGRRADVGPNQSSAMEETDWHTLARDRFAKELSDLLYGLAIKGKFDRLILVAAPQVLGALRQDLHSEVAGRVVAEVPKTLTNHPVSKIEKALQAELEVQ